VATLTLWDDIRDTSDIVYITEAHWYAAFADFTAHDVWEPRHMPDGSRARMMTADTNQHNSKVNMGYFDCHVESRGPSDVEFADFNPYYQP
jgi:prepilin-type processing-associated H-X9-DG protein